MFDPGSFRDPGSRVILDKERILRAIYPPGSGAFEAARDAGVLQKAVERGQLLPFEELVDRALAPTGPTPAHLLEHPRIPFVSYPYEWTFSALRDSALLQLNLHLALLEDDFTLSDATAYNVQFEGTRPVFIDHASIVPYAEGAPWIAQRQFAMQYLGPLVLWAHRGVAPNAWFRGSLEGIPPEDLAPLLPFKDRLSFNILAHLIAPAMVSRRAIGKERRRAPTNASRLPKRSFVSMLTSLRDFVSGLKLGSSKSVWADYATNNSYETEQQQAKREFVAKHVRTRNPTLLFDIGCNTGAYSTEALLSGARYVVGFDFDFGALEQAYDRFKQAALPILPLWLDASNPSPQQGWAQLERKGLGERATADMVLALALVHHLAIAKNVPLGMTLDWLMRLAPYGVVEFPSKRDPMVQELLRHREDIFPDYDEDKFRSEIAARGEIVDSTHLGKNGRLLVAYATHRG